MGKRIRISSVFAIVLLYQLLNTNLASAGFFDWLVSKESNPVIVHNMDTYRISPSNNVWNFLKENSVEKEVELRVVKTYEVRATGYSSTPDQTDDSPFITASGTYVRDGIIATNILPFGTKVRIPDLYGDKIFIVEDRMNKRYWMNIDIWFPDRNTALIFGSKNVIIEVVEES